MKSSIHWLATALCALTMFATGSAFGAASEFTATTDSDNNGYNGTVKAGGDGYAFTAEDSARYYKFLYLYSDLLLDGTVCAGGTNWHTANIGTYASHPVTVTVTNGARMVTGSERNILFRGKGGTIVVSEPTDASFEWGRGGNITTVLGNTYPNQIGTVGYNSKFTLCPDVTSDTGTNDILRLLAHGTASYLFVSNQNANVAARILFEGGDLRSIYNDATKFQVADGAKIILQSVDGNPIILRSYAYSRYSFFAGAGTLETAGDGDVVLLQHSYAPAKTVSLGADEGGRIVWGNTGNFKLGGRMCLKLTSDDVLPHGEGKGKVMIAVGEYTGTGTSEAAPVVIDLNGTANTVNGIGIGGNTYYSKWHVITNSSATVATLGLDVSTDKNLHEIMTTNLAANAASSIRLKKIGAGKLSIADAKAIDILEHVAGTEVTDGVLWFGNNYTLTRPLTVTGSGSIQVREDVQYARTLNLSAIPDADLSIGGLTVDTAYYYGKTPTITKFRPAANGTLHLTNVSGKIERNFTVPINLTTVVDPANFESWSVEANGTPVRFATVSYTNGVLRVLVHNPTVIVIR